MSVKLSSVCFSLLGLILLASPATAGETKVAVAANFTAASQEIAMAFEQQTGHRAVLIFGSTGKLFAQIRQGAPFDVYLAADKIHAQKAIDQKLAVAGSGITYARGLIALFSRDLQLTGSFGQILTNPHVRKIAIANPQTAPYGLAAVEVMTGLGLYDKLAHKLVRGDNIAQTYQFVMTGNAQLGFVATSQIKNRTRGKSWDILPEAYSPLEQDAVLLKKGADNPAARAFLVFLKSKQSYAIIKKYGYGSE